MNSDSVIEIQSEWNKQVTRGLQARENKDSSQWMLGDLAREVETQYGDDSIGKFAKAINVERKTLMNYRTVSSSFPKEIRHRFRTLTFSHFATLTGVTAPEPWLEQALENHWSVEQLRNEVDKVYKKVKPPAMIEEVPEVHRCEQCHMWRLKELSYYDICRGHYRMVKGKTYYE